VLLLAGTLSPHELMRGQRIAAERRVRTPPLVSAVDTAFHASQHDDQMIANNLGAAGLATTQRQVKRVRLANGWRRRANNDDQLAEMRAETFALTKQATEG
jgi:hypothetical protein